MSSLENYPCTFRPSFLPGNSMIVIRFRMRASKGILDRFDQPGFAVHSLSAILKAAAEFQEVNGDDF